MNMRMTEQVGIAGRFAVSVERCWEGDVARASRVLLSAVDPPERDTKAMTPESAFGLAALLTTAAEIAAKEKGGT
jgi:hypothetical protein